MLYPATHVIEKCGGREAVAEMAGVHITRVLRWTLPKDRHGTGGTIPGKHHVTLMARARERGIKLVPDDFFVMGPQKRKRVA